MYREGRRKALRIAGQRPPPVPVDGKRRRERLAPVDQMGDPQPFALDAYGVGKDGSPEPCLGEGE